MSIQTAEQYEAAEQYEQAYEEYKKEHEKHPNDLSITERLGHLAMMLNKKNEAADYYTQILEKDMTNTLCYEQLMDIYADTDRYKYYIYRGNLHTVEHKLEQAINDYKKALNHTDDNRNMVMTRFTLANLYEQTGNTAKAIDEFLKTLEYEDNHEEVFSRLADLYTKENMLSSAIDVLERAMKKFDTENIREKLAKLYLQNNQLESAKNLTRDNLLKIKCLLECKELEEADKKLKETEYLYKNTPEYFSLRAEYYYIINEYDKALEYVEKYNELNHNSPLVYQMRALIYENKHDEYNEHLNWGKYNLVRGNKDIAVNEFLNAFQFREDDVDLMNTLAVLLEETGDKNHAVEFWEKISKAEPANKKALEKLADFREGLGDYKTEADYLERLYELDKRNTIVIRRLAQVYEKIKNKPEAVEFYKKYLELAKGSADYEKIQQRLEKLEHTEFIQEDEGLLDKIMKFFNK